MKTNPKKMRNHKKMKANTNVDLEDMDDEVDLFHKQRDKIPININGDSDDSDDDELPVFDNKGSDEDGSEDDEEEEDDEDEDEEDDEEYNKSLAKIEQTQKYLKAKHGNLEDDFLDDDDEEDTEEQRTVWGRAKSNYYNADNVDFELQSDDGSAKEEEELAIGLRKEALKTMTMEDFGIEDDENDSDAEPTLGQIMVKKKDASLPSKKKDTEGSNGIAFEEVQKDLSSLSKDEQMDVVSSSAPELVGLLSELNDALTQLDQINPLVSKLKLKKETTKKEELHYLEVKKLLLLLYSQAITCYLLLKSEGHPVRDHPVITRLVEIKSLLDKIRVLDENLPSGFEELLNEIEVDVDMSSAGKDTTTVIEKSSDGNDKKRPIAVQPKTQKLQTVETIHAEVQNKKKHPKEAFSSQSVQMLSVRAALEEKLKRKGIFTTVDPNSQKAKKQKSQRHNSQLETFDDFGDDAVDVEGNTRNGHPSTLTNKISEIITTKGNKKVSGDDDLPIRDDLGERRRKHELRVLSGAGVYANDDGAMEEDDGDDESDDELDNLQKAKLANKNPIEPAIPSELETVDGKRLITQQMEKNRGLTPHRKKLTKNPRKKYKLKHEKAKKRHAGQVRQVKKPQGPYGGESTGINVGVSRSIRFKG